MAASTSRNDRATLAEQDKDSLISRVHSLERQLKAETSKLEKLRADINANKLNGSSRPYWKRELRETRPFDPSKHSKRFIALKIAYRGKNFNGFEWSRQETPQPTIEEELWKALRKSHLISPSSDVADIAGDWGEFNYSKCGRTDKGVSAFGQVIALTVRSARPNPDVPLKPATGIDDANLEIDLDTEIPSPTLPANEVAESSLSSAQPRPLPPFDDIHDELPYCIILNRLLPPEIRVLAWCPHPPSNFSARFACRERQYKYFFANPAYHPCVDPRILARLPTETQSRQSGLLDLDRMQAGAKLYEGHHDFRNFCKLDDSKEITNFERRIFYAGVEEEGKGLYSFNVHGSAFLWHQVRHMVAVLFLIGQGLEDPSLISTLLNVKTNPRKPAYQMAADAPLVLWDCIFPALDAENREISTAYPKKNALEWIHTADVTGGQRQAGPPGRAYGMGSLLELTAGPWREAQIDEVLARALLQRVEGGAESSFLPDEEISSCVAQGKASTKSKGPIMQPVIIGGPSPAFMPVYKPVMSRALNLPIEEQNARNLKRRKANRARKDAASAELVSTADD